AGADGAAEAAGAGRRAEPGRSVVAGRAPAEVGAAPVGVGAGDHVVPAAEVRVGDAGGDSVGADDRAERPDAGDQWRRDAGAAVDEPVGSAAAAEAVVDRDTGAGV